MTETELLKGRVLRAIHDRPTPARPPPGLARRLSPLLAFGAMAAVLVAWGGPAGTGLRPAPLGAGLATGLVLLAAGMTWALVPARRSMLPPPSARLLLLAAGAPLAVAAWLAAGHLVHADPFARAGLRCLALTLNAAPWPFLALLAAIPRSVPDRAPLLGAALGATAGGWASVVAELWCPLTDPAHVAVGHALPVALLAVAGAFLGAHLLRLRPPAAGAP